MTRNGKIARLPRTVREQLNRKLDDGQPSKSLVAWLNSLAPVQAILQKEFNGTPINQSNLSDWKLGGFRDWKNDNRGDPLLERFLSLPPDKLPQIQSDITDRMAAAFAAHMLIEIKRLPQNISPTDRAKAWREFRLTFASMRRYEYYSKLMARRLAPEPQPQSQAPHLTADETSRELDQILGIAGQPAWDNFKKQWLPADPDDKDQVEQCNALNEQYRRTQADLELLRNGRQSG